MAGRNDSDPLRQYFGGVKMKIQVFKVKPYEIELESGKKQVIDDDVVIGNVKKDGGFSGAVFESGEFQGSVTYSKAEWKKMRGEEL